jgi:hypothetical protein
MNDEREQMGDRIQVLPPAKAKPLVTPVAPPPSRPKPEPRWVWWLKWADRIGTILAIGAIVICLIVAAFSISGIWF